MNYRVKQGAAALLVAAVIAALTNYSGAAGLIALIGVALLVWGLLSPAERS